MPEYLLDPSKATKSAFVIEGDEPFLSDFWRNKLLSQHKIESSCVVALDVEESSIGAIVSALAERSLYSDQTAILIQNVCAISDKDRKRFLKNLTDCPSLVIGFTPNLYRLKKTLTGFSDSFVKQLSSRAHFLDANKKADYMLLNWIKKRTQPMALRSGQEEIILELSGLSLQRIENNIEKIRLLLKDGPLSDSDLRSLLGAQGSYSIYRAADLFLYGKLREFEKVLNSISRTDKPSHFLKVFSETIYKAILAKYIKSNGIDSSLYKREFPTDKKFAIAWETPLSLTVLHEMYHNLSDFLSLPFITWEDALEYVRRNQNLVHQ